MDAGFKSYRNRLGNKPEMRKAIGKVPLWVAELLNERSVLAQQMNEDFRITLRRGPVAQVGSPRHPFAAYDTGAAGDYVVVAGSMRVAVPRDLFEFIYEQEQS